MTKIVWMSDPHFQNAGLIDGLDPRKRLKAAIDYANAHYADADFAVLSGDLVGDDVEGDYSVLATYLAESDLPIYPMVGNNDDRHGFLRHLSIPQTAMPEFIQYSVDTPDGRCVFLDTHMTGSHAGELCETRLNWLAATLADAAGQPVYIFMHHPPHALGLPKQDEIKLQNGDAFLEVILGQSNVKHLFMGHVHRPTCGTIRGIPFATVGAVSFQAPAPRPVWDWDSFKPPEEAPHFAVLDLSDGDVTLQYVQFCAFDVGME